MLEICPKTRNHGDPAARLSRGVLGHGPWGSSRGALVVKTPLPSAGDVKDAGLIPGSWKIPWRREQLPTPVSLPGESHGQRSLAGYSPWGHKNKTSNLKNPKRMGTSCPAVSQGSQDGGHPRARSSRGPGAGPGFGRLWVETDQEGSAMPRVTIRWCHKTVSLWFSPGSCLTLCDPMDRSARNPPVRHQLPEFAQTHIHGDGDAIQPSHPLLSPSPPALNLSQHRGLFQGVTASHQVAQGLEFQPQHPSFQ